MTVHNAPPHIFAHAGASYHFYCAGGLNKFAAQALHYLHPPAEPTAVTQPGTLYICPMHSQVREPRPSPCPLCGVALEAQIPSLADGDNLELRDFCRRFWLSLPFSIAVMALAMGGRRFGELSAAMLARIEFALALPVVLWAGAPVFVRGFDSLVHRSLNMWTLIAFGVSAAFGYTVVACVAPQWLPAAFRSMDAVPVYFESAAVIVSLTLLGQIMELKARGATADAIKSVLRLAPQTAQRLDTQGCEVDVALAAVAVDDRLRLRPGEQVPVDGVVLEGHSAVNEAILTGEPLAVSKKPGDRLIGATNNTTGTLILRAEKIGNDTVLAHIVQLVAHAQRSKAPLQRLADRVAAYFVVAVVLCCVR